jgi:hypothetical protein
VPAPAPASGECTFNPANCEKYGVVPNQTTEFVEAGVHVDTRNHSNGVERTLDWYTFVPRSNSAKL